MPYHFAFGLALLVAVKARSDLEGEVHCLLQARSSAKEQLRAARGEDERSEAWDQKKEPLKILFVGNSFTYGPPPFGSDRTNNLPRIFKLVAESLGYAVEFGEDTVGGCSLYQHIPSRNPMGLDCSKPESDCEHVNCTFIKPSDGCTLPRGMPYWPDNNPCPQALVRQDHGAWDVVVLQDHSKIPSIPDANRAYFVPAVREYAEVLKNLGRKQKYRFGQPIVAVFNTWAYYDGVHDSCPERDGGVPRCFPLGRLSDFVKNCDTNTSWLNLVDSHECQSYALARGYAEALQHGAHLLVPAGLAWEAARGSEPIPQVCRDRADAAFGGPSELLQDLDLPLRVSNPEYARWKGVKGRKLYRYMGENYGPANCTDDCHRDIHQSTEGAYLNALVFFSTIFKASPIKADFPDGQWVEGRQMPILDGEVALTLQHVAHDVVLPHLDVWWSGLSDSFASTRSPASDEDDI